MTKKEATVYAVTQLRLLGTEKAVEAADVLATAIRDPRLEALLAPPEIRHHVVDSMEEQIRDSLRDEAEEAVDGLDDESLWEELKYAYHPTIETEEQEAEVEKHWSELKDSPTLPLPVKGVQP